MKKTKQILAIIGVIMIMFCKKEKKHDIGKILVGFAILMYGMEAMSSAVKPLADVPELEAILPQTVLRLPSMPLWLSRFSSGLIPWYTAYLRIITL
jgi:Na+/phosphate symporter